MTCRDLQPPEGALWTTELEPHPDPARAAQARQQAKRIAGALFGDRN